MSFKPSSRVAAPLILASLGFFALHCSSDEGATNSGGGGTTSTSGAGGTGVAGSSAGMAGGGISSGGSSAGSTTTAGTGGTGSPGGSGGSGGTASGGGGNGVTFAQVKDVLATSCKGSKCHDMGNEKNNIDLITADGLYQRLTMPIPDNISHCGGTTLVVPSNVANSFLVTATAGPTNNKVTCKKGAGTEMIARMPDDCPDQRPCLTADKIKILQDWVAAGAPQ